MIVEINMRLSEQLIRKYMLGQKKGLLLVGSLIYSLGAFAGQEAETPTILLFFGRFHPLLLHLPIGALLLTFFMEIVARIRKQDNSLMIVNALAFSAFFSVTTAILGYFLSLEGGYGKEVLQIHMYAGFVMAFLTCLLFYVKKKVTGKYRKSYLPLFITTLLLTVITGHYGSILTHGDTFLTAYAPIDLAEDKEVIAEVDSLYYYKDVVKPILEDKCVQCHNPNKTKGELNLSEIEHLVKGGENGEVIFKGKSEESPMYTSLMLPLKEDEHMPPSGKPQLTTNEIWLIKHWIDSGADFKKQMAAYKKNDTLSKLLVDYLVFPERKVSEAESKDVNELIEFGFTLRKIVYDEPFLSATYSNSGKQISKEAMKSLTQISDQLVELNLQESKLTDALFRSVKELPYLQRLRLDDTSITDKSLENLRDLEDLVTLNLFNTKVTEKGLEDLLQVLQLEKVFFGNEERKSLKDLAIKTRETRVLGGVDDSFIEKINLEEPIIPSQITVFEKDIEVEIKQNIKNEKIYYTLDGSEPDSTSILYEKPVVLTNSATLKARSYKDGWHPSAVLEKSYEKVKYEIKAVEVEFPAWKSFPGVFKVNDLKKGSKEYKDGHWVGFKDDFIAILDLEKEGEFSGVSVNCIEKISSYIFFPRYIEIYAGNDKESMTKLGELKLPMNNQDYDIKIKNYDITFPSVKARYIKVFLKNLKVLPSWHRRAGDNAYVFIDEIKVL